MDAPTPSPAPPSPKHAVLPGGDGWWWLWILGGAVYGVAMRALFGWLPGDLGGPMSMGFLLGTPTAIGAIVVYGARRHDPSILTMIFAPWVAIVLTLIGCGIALLEGSICLAIMSPLFFFCGSVGGLFAGAILRTVGARRGTLPALALLPLLAALADTGATLPTSERAIVRDVVVDAPAEVIWDEIVSAKDIAAGELPASLVHAIGVPKPIEGVNRRDGDVEVRQSRWERGVHFRGIVTHRAPGRAIAWRYEFDPDSFPPGSMDDHVAIGGRYFALHDTAFELLPLADGRTRLRISARYRVSSRINFYAIPVSELLGRDFVDTILGLYKGRSERTARARG